jgi:LPXTG-motif cell wall-anchored protein
VDDGDVELPAVSLTSLPALATQITVTGSPVVGETLTAVVSPVTDTDGNPVAGVETAFNWGYGRGQSGDNIDGATGLTVVVPEEAVGGTIGYAGYLRAEGFRPTLVGSNGLVVSAPVKTARPAPVADSSELGAYLDSLGVEREAADKASLPAKVEQGKAQTASLEWWGGDSYVDVYAYSAPVFLGSFAVVDGSVSLTLTPELLAQLGEGSHTLVFVGQSSGSVQAVAFEIGGSVVSGARLAETGADPILPIGVGGALLILGAGVLIARRRSAIASR